MRCSSLWRLLQCYLVLKNMILGFDFLGFQVIKHFQTKNRLFLHIMQCTITNNSFLLVFYSYILVFYPYVTGMYLVCTRMLLVCTRMYSYVTRMYSCNVLVTIQYGDRQVQYDKQSEIVNVKVCSNILVSVHV